MFILTSCEAVAATVNFILEIGNVKLFLGLVSVWQESQLILEGILSCTLRSPAGSSGQALRLLSA